MSAYNELIKNFERIRSYMRDFYVYGFKSRDGYQSKSARSYDDERRRMESWLGDHMSFVRTPEGNVNLDFGGKMNGRGAYLCPNPECLKKAIRSKALDRSLEVEIPQEVYDRLQKEMEAGTNG